MPNHVHTRMSFSGKKEDIEKLRSAIVSEGRAIDFYNIVPMPPCVKRNPLSQEDIEETHKGHNAYEWCVRRWGTKWNAYNSFVDSDGSIRFKTAWSFPVNIIQELSYLFPSVEIKCLFLDEGINFWGQVFFVGGVVASGSVDDLDYTLLPYIRESLGQ